MASEGGGVVYCKLLLDSVENLDRLQIKNHLDSFSIVFQPDESVKILRNQLKKVLLEEILKVDKSKKFHEKMTEVCHSLKSDKSGFRCSLVGCRTICERHKDYIFHLKADHPNLLHFKCNFNKECPQSFNSILCLIQHLKEFHSSRQHR